MNCKSCGKLLPEGVAFCPTCGTSVYPGNNPVQIDPTVVSSPPPYGTDPYAPLPPTAANPYPQPATDRYAASFYRPNPYGEPAPGGAVSPRPGSYGMQLPPYMPAPKRRNGLGLILGIVAIVLIIAFGGIAFAMYQAGKSAVDAQATATAQERQPNATTAANANATSTTTANAAYPAVDGVSCDASEQLAYHIHVHLSIYINGTQNPLPQNIGIASDNSCLYWLHTHDTTGVIHIESPTQKNYTLGDFFDEWSGRFSSLGYPPELDSASGWTIWVNVNGKTVNVSNFRNISLTAHTLITMAYNSPNVKPDTTYNWNGL